MPFCPKCGRTLREGYNFCDACGTKISNTGGVSEPQTPIKASEPKPKKNPWIAAILNLFILGAGYVYNGKRVGVGLALLASIFIASILLLLSGGFSYVLGLGTHTCGSIINSWMVDSSIISIILACDAYKEAQEINQAQ